MSETSPVYLLLNRDDENLKAKIRALSPRIEIVLKQQLEVNPNLLTKIEIIYGGNNESRWSTAPNLRWIQITGAGANHWLTPELVQSELILTNVSGIHARAITEHMFALLLSTTRALPDAWEGQKSHTWKHLGSNVQSLYGKTLGILGMGAIGAQAARVGRIFEMKTIGLRRSGESHPDVEVMYSPETRLDFFQRCDVVMNLLPETKKTHGFMSDAEFAALPVGAIVINAGRGSTIDTDALIRALNSGRLRAALLDVTDPEPLPQEHPLWDTKGVFITPHYSGAHPEYNAEADEIFLDNLRLYLAGEPLHHIVNKQEGY
jgi:D-2-hydroxyacid dehydrogenase (NADP+)